MRTMSGSPCPYYDRSNRNSFGYCKTTVCINEHYQQEQWGSPSTTNKFESVVKKPQTNVDRIRSLSDEELAEFLERKTPWYRCENCKFESCKDCCLDWLKEEAKGGGI